MLWLSLLAILTGVTLGLALKDLDRAHMAMAATVRASASMLRSESEPKSAGAGASLPAFIRTMMFWFRPISRTLLREQSERILERELAVAGHPLGLTVESLMDLRVLAAIAGMLFGIYMESLWLTLLFAGVGYFGPVEWVKSQGSARQAHIRADLPDFLDIIAISLSAGASVDMALRDVTQQFDGPLQEEMEEVNAQVTLGVPRQEALRKLLDRTNCRELEVLVLAMVHGIGLGVPLAQTMEEQARAIRGTRSQRARQLAAAAAPKITLVSTLLVTPSVLALIVGLLVINFFTNDSMSGFRDLFGGF